VTGKIYLSVVRYIFKAKNELAHAYPAIASTPPPFLEASVQHLDHICPLKVELSDLC